MKITFETFKARVERNKNNMDFIIYSIYDTVSKRYRQPMFLENAEAAKRFFAYIISKDEMMSNNPEQFELHELASFNDQTGEITVEDEAGGTVGEPSRICKGTDLLPGKEK